MLLSRPKYRGGDFSQPCVWNTEELLKAAGKGKGRRANDAPVACKF